MGKAIALAAVSLFLTVGAAGCWAAYQTGLRRGRDTTRQALDDVYQAIVERAGNQMEPPQWGQIQAIVDGTRRHYTGRQ